LLVSHTSITRQGPVLGLAQRTQYTLGRQRHFQNAHFDGIIKRISNRRRNTEHTGLADSLGPKWPVLVRHFDEFAGEIVREVEHTGDLIIGEAGIYDLSLIDDHFLENSEAELHFPGTD